MTTFSITVLGGDLRQCYLADYLYAKEHDVVCYGTMPFSYKYPDVYTNADTLSEAVSDAILVICPTPFSQDGQHLYTTASEYSIPLRQLLETLKPGQILAGGGIPKTFLESLQERQITVIDLLEDSALTLANAALTAEGLLAALISETPFSLMNHNVLILGFGRCGQEIGKRLSSFDIEISAYDIDHNGLSAAAKMGIQPIPFGQLPDLLWQYDIIINTVPKQILSDQQFNALPRQTVFFDIASAPYGFDPALISPLKQKYIRCPGIPGKFMPQTAGELIGKTILERMLSHEF